MAHPLAGKIAPAEMLVDVEALLDAYHAKTPDAKDPAQAVSFGTSGHRGTSLATSFNEAHILAVTQAVCDYRAKNAITGPLYIGIDTHALSAPAFDTALCVLAANGVTTRIAPSTPDGQQVTPTPLVSRAILAYNAKDYGDVADGIVITPSHNPPADGGFKYNPPSGGPAGAEATSWIEQRANELLLAANDGVKTMPNISDALAAPTTSAYDFIGSYIIALRQVIDLQAIKDAGIRMGVDPLGGSALPVWQALRDYHGLDITVVNDAVDPQFAFMPLDKDGVTRMDCSSPYAMASLLHIKDDFQLGFGNDPDGDRHGIVTPAGLMNPNHYLAACIDYLFGPDGRREKWPADIGVGKTLVSSAIIDRVAALHNARLVEVPVGFKWFVDGLLDGSLGFGGEESAGASFLKLDGTAWSTDKDGILLCLLAAEMVAKTGEDPARRYVRLTAQFGAPVYERLQAPASREQKALLKTLSPSAITATELAGEPITAILTEAPGNGAPIGGLKVTTENGWFAARPSGTEDIYKIYVESMKGHDHLEAIKAEAQAIVNVAFAQAGLTA